MSVADKVILYKKKICGIFFLLRISLNLNVLFSQIQLYQVTRSSLLFFLKYVCEYCEIIQILDMLHGVKSGKNKLLQNTVKLGNKCYAFISETLSIDLCSFDQVLMDQTRWGKCMTFIL